VHLPGWWAQREIPTSLNWNTLEDNGKRGTDGEKTNEDYISVSCCICMIFRNSPELPSMPMRNGRHRVRSAKRNRKKPIDSLMKLYAAMIKIE
jgi:hypothetical protein